MTKEVLEKEAEEWIKDHSGLIGGYKFVKYDYDSMQKAYLAGAEPREKRIAELERFIKTQDRKLRQLSKECDKAIDRVEKLEAQIEKMKWHDLEKDPNDLPNKSNPISSYTVLDQNGDRCWYNFKDRQWENDKCRTDGTYDCKVIAWCELPKWEIKENDRRRTRKS